MAWNIDFEKFAVISCAGHDEQQLYLSKMYQDYLSQESPDNFLTLTKQIQTLLQSRHSPVNNDERLAQLLPCIRTLNFFQNSNNLFRTNNQGTFSEEKELVYFPYADVMGMGLVLDQPETMKHVRYCDLQELNLDVEDAIDIAVENLKRISDGPLRVVQPGFYSSPWKDSYDTGRLMITEIFAGLKVDGELVALSPADNALFVTGSNDKIGLELLTALGQSFMRQPRNIAALPLVLRDGVWQPFIVTPEHPAFDAVNTYRLNVLSVLYKGQDNSLTNAAAASGAVVSPFVIETDRGRDFVFSKTSVLENNICVFPETDVVEFFKSTHECLARAPFELVEQILHNKLSLQSEYRPRRWILSSFPTPVELQRLAVLPPFQSPVQSASIPELQILSQLFSLPVPESTRIDSDLRTKDNIISIDLVVSCTPVDLTSYYLEHLPIGGYIMIGTERGDFHVAEIISAGCSREIWFGPSEKRGESLLRFRKITKYDSPNMLPALTKQHPELYALEQTFGISIINDSVPQGELKLSPKSAKQIFHTPYPPDEVCRFYRCQLSDQKAVYMPAEQGNPYLITDTKTGMSVTIKSEQTPQGTMYWIAKDV